jgi:hypothetical protein
VVGKAKCTGGDSDRLGAGWSDIWELLTVVPCFPIQYGFVATRGAGPRERVSRLAVSALISANVPAPVH